MCEIIRDWLTQSMGIIFEFDLTSFGDLTKDGLIIAKILYSYGIISYNDLKSIEKTDDPDLAYENAVRICEWLKRLNINLPDKSLWSISKGEGSAAIKLFYQLYFTLRNKEKLNYVIQHKFQHMDDALVRTAEKHDYVCCKEKCESSFDFNESSMEIYKWHKKNSKKLAWRPLLADDYKKKSRRTFSRNIITENMQCINDIRKLDKLDISVDSPPLTYPKPQPINLVDSTLNCTPHIQQPELAFAFVHRLKHKHRKLNKEKSVQVQKHKLLLANLLKSLSKTYDYNFTQKISQKLLKQSVYEKRMLTKLFEVHHHKNVFIENRNKVSDLWCQELVDAIQRQFPNEEHVQTVAERKYILEKKRLNALHKKIYRQRQQQKYIKKFMMCYEMLKDIVSLSIKRNEYEEYFETEVPEFVWNQWKTLFVAGLDLRDAQNIVEIVTCDDQYDDYEPFNREIYKEQCLDEKDFTDYINLEWQWSLLNDEYDEDIFNTIYLGNRILGYIVHKLLLIRYPLPAVPVPELPKTDLKICISGFKDENALQALEILLNQNNIIIVNITSAVEYCIKAYSEESIRELDEIFVEETDKSSKKKGKKDKGEKTKKEKVEKGNKPKGVVKVSKSDVPKGPVEMVSQEVQTPIIYPCEEIQYTTKGELGKYAFETLKLGSQLNDDLLVAMLVEYLKTFPDILGWVLLNYPDNLNEAITLEETLTGYSVPFKDEVCYHIEDFDDFLFSRQDLFIKPIDPFEMQRLSKLVPNVNPIVDTFSQKSFFDTFIRIIQNKPSKMPLSPPCNVCSDIDIIYEKFCNYYVFQYEKFDNATSQKLLKIIMGEESIVSPSVDNKNIQDNLDKIVKGIKDDTDKSGSIEICKTDYEDIIEEQEAEEYIPKPGEPDWVYIDLPQPFPYVDFLPVYWEYLEEIYINDFKELFFVRRTYQNGLAPYIRNAEIYMKSCIERSDYRQMHLYEFQKRYNEIEYDLRDDDEFKSELHCRIDELLTTLWEICDQRMNESESERQQIINNDWFPIQTADIINLYITAMQLELDRSVGTIELIQEYYICMLLPQPIEINLMKYTLTLFPTLRNISGIAPTKMNLFQDITNAIRKYFLEPDEELEINPFAKFLNATETNAKGWVVSWSNVSKNGIKLVEKFYEETKSSKATAKKGKKPKVESPVPAIEASTVQIALEEWNSALDGEILRILFRLNLLKTRAATDVEETLEYGGNLFHKLYNNIDKRYKEEVKSVDEACELLGRAVEACEPIQPKLILEGSEFYVDFSMLMYPDDRMDEQPLQETPMILTFTISQLLRIADVFLYLSPKGNIPVKAFIYILIDLVTLDTEDGRESFVPPYWRYLTQYDVTMLVKQLFGDTEFIDWKEFIICCLNIPFPTEIELLDIRKKFKDLDPKKLECVSFEAYSSVRFWFEYKDVNVLLALRIKLIKQLLFKLFKVVDKVNYSMLLLYFCKDMNPLLGVAKALELSIGTLVCWKEEMGIEYMESLRYERFLREQEMLAIVDSVVCSMITRSTAPESQSEISNPSLVDSENYKEIENYHSHMYVCEEEQPPDLIDYKMPITYIISFEILLMVMTAALPWEFRGEMHQEENFRCKLEKIYEACQNEEFDNIVFIHELLSYEEFKEMYTKNFKFQVRFPHKIVQDLIEICTCKYDECL